MLQFEPVEGQPEIAPVQRTDKYAGLRSALEKAPRGKQFRVKYEGKKDGTTLTDKDRTSQKNTIKMALGKGYSVEKGSDGILVSRMTKVEMEAQVKRLKAQLTELEQELKGLEGHEVTGTPEVKTRKAS